MLNKEETEMLKRAFYVDTTYLLLTNMKKIESLQKVRSFTHALWTREHPEEFAKEMEALKKGFD
ncbi:hypothetical protein D7V86_23680 [bacterium D16-51]|nr:hypothetical protein D7V96_24465 [bacterium D16-59]RKI54416.1 hypothetical protein D7V86_23680 [bacterium D16-51]